MNDTFRDALSAAALTLLGLMATATPAAEPSAPTQAIPSSAYESLQWRLIGPFRGGWATMAIGVPQQPDTFYFGAAGGGVWKSENAGRTWKSIGDALPPSVGALAVAPTNPNTLYVGTGQPEPRYDIGAGRGVFKSTDGGKSWSAIGLTGTRYTGAIWVDPRNENTVVVGALGHFFGPSPDRGIYRSTDGGTTWTHALAIDDTTGVVDLASDPSDPNLLYAAAWQVRDWPWQSYYQPIEGPGSAIYRSTDGGASWSRLGGEGWPAGPLGRIGLAVTHTAAGTRIYASVTSDANGGIWRSDDGGSHWARVNSEGDKMAVWYFSRLAVEPRDPDTLYSAGQSIRRSRDAGKTWEEVKGAPGGDDYHFYWINPAHPERRITASDQGAVVSVDNGVSWSDWYNQPTGQFYHLATDERFPYWIYSGQQDSGTVGAASRSDYGSLTFRDWHPVGGEERDYMIPDPDNADVVFGSGLGAHQSRWSAVTGQSSNITPWLEQSYGRRQTTVKYRYGWVEPMVFTPTKPHALLLGAQLLFRSVDHGRHWQAISPDLTGAVPGANHDDKRCGGVVAIADATECGYGVIHTIAPSPLDAGLIWVGTDNGRIQLTRDGGAHWRNVSAKGVPDWAQVSTIDASALDAGTAYVAIDNQRQDDFRPHVLRTHDFGETWTEIGSSLPSGQFVSVVRADPVRRGLLYAGTAEGVYVSFDDGGQWQPLQQNLPRAWVRDLLVHGDDLIAATQGRAIWVLDDVQPLRELAAPVLHEEAHLFAPQIAWRVHANNNLDTPLPPETPIGQNPPAGVPIDYWLGAGVHGPVTLEIRDAAGAVVRRFSSEDKPEAIDADRYFEADWLKPEPMLAATPGMHRFVWNLRFARPRALAYDYSIAAVFGEDTPTNIEGTYALPGSYQIVLRAAGAEHTAALTLKLDPRVHTKSEELHALFSFSRDLDASIERTREAGDAVKGLHVQLEPLIGRLGDEAALKQEAQALLASLDQKGSATNVNSLSMLLEDLKAGLEGADLAPTASQRAVYAESTHKLQEARQAWRALVAGPVAQLNAHLSQHQLPILAVPRED